MNTDRKKARILLANRPNAKTHPGGDTVVMDRYAEGLERHGFDVDVVLDGKIDFQSYDFVQLFNFATPGYTEQLARMASQAGVPFVVQTLLEDVPNFHTQSHAVAAALQNYVQSGQNEAMLKQSWPNIADIERSDPFENTWTATHAAALITTGASESKTVQETYPGAAQCVEIPLGCEVQAEANAELFEKKYGVRDFILCVGRIESRKNQLMLLKALEHVDIPVVLVGGGVEYQPDYVAAVKGFRRKGETLVLGRLSDEMLASAYAAAKVHALVSWYELPGLVSLEAAQHGCNVVATLNGTSKDNLGDSAFYADPSDWNSVKNAVLAAYHTPFQSEILSAIAPNRWDTASDKLVALIESLIQVDTISESEATETQFGDEIAAMSERATATFAPKDVSPEAGTTDAQVEAIDNLSMNQVNSAFQQVPDVVDPMASLEQAEAIALEGEFEKAHQLFDEAEQMTGKTARSLRSRGAVFLAESRVDQAIACFEQSLAMNAKEPRALFGFGMCCMMKERWEDAYRNLLAGLEIEPMYLVGIRQLIECSYHVERYDALELALARYLSESSDNLDLQFCRAGALFKLNRFAESEAIVHEILEKDSSFNGAEMLLEMIQKNRSIASSEQGKSVLQNEISVTSYESDPNRAKPEAAYGVTESTEGAGETNVVELDQALEQMEHYKRTGDLEKFAELADNMSLKIVQADDSRREWFTLLRAEVLAKSGEVAIAEEIFDAILAGNPKCARALCGKGAIVAHRGNWDDAKSFFEHALGFEPDYDVALAGLGLYEAQSGNFEAAWGFYGRSLMQNPENQRALLGIVEIGPQLGKLADVQQALESYLDMHPADLTFIYSYAACLYALGNFQECLTQLQKILIFEPQNVRAIELKGLAESQMSGARTGQ